MKRLPNESYEDYRKRREDDNIKTRAHLRGRVIWPGAGGQIVRKDGHVNHKKRKGINLKRFNQGETS